MNSSAGSGNTSGIAVTNRTSTIMRISAAYGIAYAVSVPCCYAVRLNAVVIIGKFSSDSYFFIYALFVSLRLISVFESSLPFTSLTL